MLYLLMQSSLLHAKQQPSHIVASIKPIQLLINEITGTSEAAQTSSQFHATLLLEDSQNHHLRALKPSQRLLLSKARYVFYISDEFEAYLHAVKRADRSPSSVFKYIELGKLDGIRLLATRQNGEMPYIYEPQAKHHDNESHADGHSHDGHSHDALGPDWHIWLNPDNAIVMLAKIRDILLELNPEQAKIYQQNYHNAVTRITAQSQRISEKMMKIMKKPFLTLHDGYQYFEEQYGLKSAGSILRHDDGQPSIQRISETRRLIETQNIRCVFKSPRFSGRALLPVTEGFAIHIVDLDAMGTASDTQVQTYTDLIEQFAGVFYTSLSHESALHPIQ